MDKINVTKTFLSPINEYEKYVKEIWSNGQLTNQGPLLRRFEEETSRYLGVKNFHFVSSGTSALQIAINALGITEGEIITTPFSYVASTSAILWEKCKPVYVDIDPDTLCIDPTKIEEAITPNTKAILAVHVFGNPCAVEEIDIVAKKHNIKVIYDGAHAFGVKYKGRSLLSYGDISTCSFHATKLFHTIEGGCLVVNQKAVSEKVELIKRFGHNGDDHIMLGINAKASEFQAAMGLCNLKYIDEIIQKRKMVSGFYEEHLKNEFKTVAFSRDTERNYAYYPILFSSEAELIKRVDSLNKRNIFPRRYFYPSLNKLNYLKQNQECIVAEDIAPKIICLPLYPDLENSTVKIICNILMSST